MFKLGEYSVDEAKIIAGHLRDAGMKVDIRTFTVSSTDIFDHLEGRMSELKEEIDDEEYEKYEQYLNAFRKVLAEGATSENFLEMLQLELDPQVNEKRRLYHDIMDGDLSFEEREAKWKENAGLMSELLLVARGEAFIDTVIERNNIQIDEVVGNCLDDPIIRIFVDLEEDEEDYEVEGEVEGDDEEEEEYVKRKLKMAKTTTAVHIESMAEVFVDEVSAIYFDDLDEEFKDKYYNESFNLFILEKLNIVLRKPSPGKIDMESFEERCIFQMDRRGDLIEVDGSCAAEEIARALEKNGIIKIKGDSIKWKR